MVEASVQVYSIVRVPSFNSYLGHEGDDDVNYSGETYQPAALTNLTHCALLLEPTLKYCTNLDTLKRNKSAKALGT